MDTELSGWRRVRVVAALIGALFGFVIVVLAVLPGAPYLPDGLEFIPFIMIFPLFGWAVIERALDQASRRKGQPRQKWYERGMTSNAEAKRAWNDMWVQVRKYRVILVIGIPVLIVMWVLMGYSIVSIQGQPERVGNHSYLNDHGSEIPVTQAGYENAVAKQELIFAAAGTMFLVVSAALTLTFDPNRSVSSEAA
jgi:hypothetical protein